MSDDLFNEGGVNYRAVAVTLVFVVFIVVAGLYFVGRLPWLGGSDGSSGVSGGGNESGGNGSGYVSEVPLNSSEVQNVENAIKNKVVLIKYVVYKSDSGGVIGVAGYLGVKSDYYDDIVNDVVFSVQNVPAKNVKVVKKVYSKDYKGYVVLYFELLPVNVDSFNVDKVDLLVLYLSVPYRFSVDLSKNVKVVKSDYSVELQYSVPRVASNPVTINVVFSVFGKYRADVKKVVDDIVMHFQDTKIVMNGDERYFMSAVDYNTGDNFVGITYRSPVDVQSGVYSLEYNYYVGGKEYVKNLGRMLVNNTATVPSFLSFDFARRDGKVVVEKSGDSYMLNVVVHNVQSSMSLPIFRVRIYDYDLNLIDEVNLDNKLLSYGDSVVNLNVPKEVVENKGVYYFVFRLMAPDESVYSVVLKLDSSSVVIPENSGQELGSVKFLVYPTQYHTHSMYVDYDDNSQRVVLNVPLLLMYPNSDDVISVNVVDMFGNEYNVNLKKIVTYSVSSSEVVPVFAGMFKVVNVPLTSDFVVTVELPDGSSVKGSVNLFNIYYNGDYLNGLFGSTIVENSTGWGSYYDCDEVKAFEIIANSMGISTKESISEYLNDILESKLLFDRNDVSISDGKIVINIAGGVASKLMWVNWVSYAPFVQGNVKNVRLLVRQNENPMVSMFVNVKVSYSDGSVVIDAPFADSLKYVYLVYNDYIIPLNWVRTVPSIDFGGFDYTIYTYFDPVFNVKADEDLGVLGMSVMDDNPVARAILSDKVQYAMQFSSLMQPPEIFDNNDSANASAIIFAGNDTTIDSPELSTIDFLVGSDEPLNSAKVIVNGVDLPADVVSYARPDYYVVKISVSYDKFNDAISGVKLADVLSGEHIITIVADGKSYYNLVPFSVPISWFMVTGDLMFVNVNDSGDLSVVKCGGNSLNVVYDVSVPNVGGTVVYEYPSDCKLTLVSDLYGSVRLSP